MRVPPARSGDEAPPLTIFVGVRVLHPLIVSEAACLGHAPENTLAGIEAALTLGADAIEVDVRATADGVPVLIHDETVDRTTNGGGAISDMPLSAVRKLDAGGGQQIPTLAETLDLIRGRVLLVAEIKQPDIEEALLRVVHDLGATTDCEAHSFDTGIVARIRAAEPRMPAALLVFGREIADWPAFFDLALSLNAQGVSVHGAYSKPAVVRAAQRRSLTFTAWMVDEEKHIRAIRDAGVDRICTSYPDIARRCL
jgi:glycerophosphoryl diester phosphodiesterase